MSGHDIIDLDDLASRTMRYADQLRMVSLRFHGHVDNSQNPPHIAGVKLLYEEALDAALNAIYNEYEGEGKRPPAEDVRTARARIRVKREHPDLYDEYHALDATLHRIERWLRDSRHAIMARQSVLKTERELAGKVIEPKGGYDQPIGART